MVFVSHDIQTVKRISDRVVTMYLGRIVEQTPGRRGSPRSPSTRTPGRSSRPRRACSRPLDPIPLVGPVPLATNPPSGCPFRTRCWKATDGCAIEMPPVRSGDGGAGSHEFRCYHPVPAGSSNTELVELARAATGRTTPLHRRGDSVTTPTPRFAGVVPPVVTPLTEEGAVDVASLERLVERMLERRRRRHLRPRQLRRDRLPHRQPAGPGSRGRREDRRRAPYRSSPAASSRPPAGSSTGPTRRRAWASTAWWPPHPSTPSSARTRSSGTSGRSPRRSSCPLLAYDIPVCVHTKLSPGLLSQLAAEGVLAGVKDSSGDDVAFRQLVLAIAERAPDAGFSLLTGHEVVVDAMMLAGASGSVPGLANVDPAGYVRLHRACVTGDWDTARAEQDRLTRLFRIVDAADPATAAGATRGVGAFKTALALLGVIDSNAVSLPLRPLDADETAGFVPSWNWRGCSSHVRGTASPGRRRGGSRARHRGHQDGRRPRHAARRGRRPGHRPHPWPGRGDRHPRHRGRPRRSAAGEGDGDPRPCPRRR